jgi:hypothetical protein
MKLEVNFNPSKAEIDQIEIWLSKEKDGFYDAWTTILKSYMCFKVKVKV